MPQFAIKFSGVKKVPANSLLGNSTGAAASASGLSASDARTLLGLATSDSPTFGGLDVPSISPSLNVLEQFNGTSEQRLSVFNTRTDSDNYERFSIRWTSNSCYLETSYDGTGTYRDLVFRARNTTYIQIDSASQSVKIHRNLYPSQNGTKRLGFSSLRWMVAYTVDLDASGDVTFGGLPTSDPASAGQLWNDSGTVKISAG